MSSVVIRGGDGNRYPANVTADGKLEVDTEISISGISIDNVTVAQDSAAADVKLKMETRGAKDVQAVGVYGEAKSEVPAEVADGAAVIEWLDTRGRQVIFGANVSQQTLDMTDVAPQAAQSGKETLHDITIDNSPTADTSESIFVGDKNKLTILNKTVVTDGTGAGPYVDFGIEVSADNSVWVGFRDIMVSGTSASGVTYGATYTDTVTIPIDYTVQYLRTTFAGVNTGVSDTVAVDSWLNWKKG